MVIFGFAEPLSEHAELVDAHTVTREEFDLYVLRVSPVLELHDWPRDRQTTAPLGAELICELMLETAVEEVSGPIVHVCAKAYDGSSANHPSSTASPT